MPDTLRRSSKVYRIIGIRRDDSRQSLRGGLTRDEATELFATLMNSEEFAAFAVERDQHPTCLAD